jgi:hypothetical protein
MRRSDAVPVCRDQRVPMRGMLSPAAVLIKPALLSYRLLAEIVKALIVANQFLETDLERLRAAVSPGYARGNLLPRDRKDWYD